MRTLESYIMEAGLDKHLLYDIVISVVENNKTIYDKCVSIAAAIEKKAKRGERPDFDYLAGSSVVDKLAAETFKIYVSKYGTSSMRLGTEERKELKRWIAAHIFHILEDEFDGLTDDVYGTASEEIEKFTHSPYYSVQDLYSIYK